MKLLIGTTNLAKQKEFKRIIHEIFKKGNLEIKLYFPQDFAIKDGVLETGTTFEENSHMKAKFYFEKTGIPTIADDGGIAIEALHGEPGIKSHRWLGSEASDEELIHYTLKRMKPYPQKNKRKASFIVCLTYFDGKRTVQEFGMLNGYIATHASDFRVPSFPYRSLFMLINGKYYYDLTQKEHEKYNHRQKALLKIFKKVIDKQ